MAMFYVEAMANSHASNMVLPWFYHEPFPYGRKQKNTSETTVRKAQENRLTETSCPNEH